MRLKWTHIIIHHTGAEEKDTAQVRKYHMSKGWRDIGYNFVVERDGKVVEGRSLGIEGAHTKGWNTKAIGLCVIGNISARELNAAQYSALVDKTVALCKKYNIPVANVLAHRQVSATECPGKLFPWEKFKTDVKNKLDGKTESQDVLEITFTKDGKKQTIVVAGTITIKEG